MRGEGGAPKGNGNARKHGLSTLRQAVRVLGSRVIDRRTTLGRALAQWRSDLLRDLGGQEGVSTQQVAVLDLAVNMKLITDSIATWILLQPSLINARKRAVLPVVNEYARLTEVLGRHFDRLGLERRAKDIPDLARAIRDAQEEGGEQAEHVQETGGDNGDRP